MEHAIDVTGLLSARTVALYTSTTQYCPMFNGALPVNKKNLIR
jgi:hypothetical protein